MGSLFYYVGKAHKKSKNFRGKFDLTIPSKDDIIIKLSGETSRDRVKEVGRSERKAKTFYRAEGFNEGKRISKKFEKRLDKNRTV